MTCEERLAAHLKEHGVAFVQVSHPTAYTAQEVAAAQDVSGKQVAKVVIVRADDEPVMLVLQAHQLVDFDKVKALLKVKSVRLAKEGELAGLFHDCEVGAMPPFGGLYKMPTYMDEGLVPQPAIVFSAGSHTESFKVKCADYMAIAKPQVAAFAKAVGRA